MVTLMVCVVVSLEGRAMHLATLVREAEQRVAELVSRVTGEGQGEREELKSWEWRLRLYRRMETGFQHSSEFYTLHITYRNSVNYRTACVSMQICVL